MDWGLWILGLFPGLSTFEIFWSEDRGVIFGMKIAAVLRLFFGLGIGSWGCQPRLALLV